MAATTTPPVVCGKQYAHPQVTHLVMASQGGSGHLIANPNTGELVFKVSQTGLFWEKKVLEDGQGNVICIAKKFPLSLAKWTITDADGKLLAKTRTIAGLAKVGIQVIVPRLGAQPAITVVPDLSLRAINLLPTGADGNPIKQAFCVAAYGSNVMLGLVSAMAQDWSYNITMDPGTDSALACMVLGIYEELVEWNAWSGLMP